MGLDHFPNDEEIIKATRKLKDEAPGDSGIPPQVWKAIIEKKHTYKICNIRLLGR